MSTKRILFGVMAGITTGTILGVMLTSKRGAAVRKKMFLDGTQYAVTLKDKFNDSLRSLSGNFEKLFNKSRKPI